MLAYIMDLLYKNKYFYINIKNLNNLGHGCEYVLDNTTSLKAIFSSYNW